MGVYNKVLEYSINFAQDVASVGAVSTNNAFADVEAVAYLSCCMVFARATNGIEYWYCLFADRWDMSLAKRILRNNSVPVLEHETMYNYTKQPALRVTCSALEKYSAGRAFVKRAMSIKSSEAVNKTVALNRIEQMLQNVK